MRTLNRISLLRRDKNRQDQLAKTLRFFQQLPLQHLEHQLRSHGNQVLSKHQRQQARYRLIRQHKHHKQHLFKVVRVLTKIYRHPIQVNSSFHLSDTLFCLLGSCSLSPLLIQMTP